MAGEILGTGEEIKPRVIEIDGLIRNLKKIKENLHGLWLVLIFFAIWEALPGIGVIDPLFLPTFSDTISTLFQLFISGKLLVHIGASLQRSLLGFALAVIVGIPLGFLMGWYNRFERYTDLFIQSLRNTSTFALLPIFLLFLGLGEASKIAIVFYGATWHILINTISGVKNVDPIYIKAAKSMGVSDKDLFRKIILPACTPSIVSGARLAAKTAILVVIAAEMIGAKSGLGFYIQNAQFNFMIPEMYAGILTLVILGLVVNYLLVWFEKKATYWKGDIDKAILG
ncbi:MAG: ABC transporter permease [Candidatus Methanoperedens sp.]|nr:ABC transporter permease [Candidatus Methanoperedens sp.]